jgi:hypothetical protein
MTLKSLLKQLNEGVTDQVQDKLSPEFFDNNKKLLPNVTRLIKQNIQKIDDMIAQDPQWKGKIDVSFDDAVFVGARATYQYSPTSDADTNIGIKILDNTVKESDAIQFVNGWIIKNLDRKVKVNGIEIQFRVSSANEDEGVSTFKAFDGVYDISGDKWIKEPDNSQAKEHHNKHVINNNALKEKYNIFKQSLKNELDILSQLNVSKINKETVKSIASKIADIFQPVYDERARAFQQDEKFLKDHGRISLNWSDENIFYKWMEDDFGDLVKNNWDLFVMLRDGESDNEKLINQINKVRNIKINF